MKTLLLSAAAVLALAVILPVSEAQAGPGGGERAGRGGGHRHRHAGCKMRDRMAKLDADKDGRISAEEASGAPRLAKNFAAIDTDADGFVTRPEMGAALIGRIFERLDSDKDGRISAAEAATAPRLEKHFSKIDADGDGYLTKDELKAAAERLRAKVRDRRSSPKADGTERTGR